MASIEPFYFGNDDSLFGIYHPPLKQPKNQSVLILNPMLEEAVRAHYALREVAQRLSLKGYHVFRFDYAGTGNSKGSLNQVTLDEWKRNTATAMKELMEVSGTRSLTVIAARYALVLLDAMEEISIDRLLVWDPVFSGESWIRQSPSYLFDPQTGIPSGESPGLGELMGFELNPSLFEELQDSIAADISKIRTTLFITDDQTVDHLDKTEMLDVKSIPFNCAWSDPTSAVLYPHDVISALCDQLP